MWQYQADTGQHNDALKLHRLLVHSQLNLYELKTTVNRVVIRSVELPV
jgi:hypothetical protein